MDPVHAATCRSATAWQACAEHAERAAVHGDKRRASVPTFERSPSKGRTLRPGRMFGCHSDSNSQLTKLRYPAFAASMISTAPSAPVPLRPSTQYSFSARRTSSRPHHVQSFSSSRDPVSSRATSRRLRTTTGWPRWSTQAFRPAYGRSVQSGVGGGGMLPCNPRFRRAASASRSLLWAASMSKRLRWMSVYSASGSFGMAAGHGTAMACVCGHAVSDVQESPGWLCCTAAWLGRASRAGAIHADASRFRLWIPIMWTGPGRFSRYFFSLSSPSKPLTQK